ncbi:glycosyltransferase family 4 protein [Desulfobacula sp.]|uniref:glycosyltransferase family 4 protein n=1 Tax=Desulfobacula sp. TaxID=2593537 RepID=UPI001EC48221|nr:glycosyltransferase family 4 protein [Desulfobacula sp.]
MGLPFKKPVWRGFYFHRELLRNSNQSAIENFFLKNKMPNNLNFLYFDFPSKFTRWKKGSRGVHFYYVLWQWGAYKQVKAIHKEKPFDLVHHITFASVRQPSFMGNLGIPFIFGPVAGGEKAPWRLRFRFGMRGFLLDSIRDVINFFVRFDPFMRMTFKQADRIYVTSYQTKKLIPKGYHKKIKIKLAIGIDKKGLFDSFGEKKLNYNILYIGRFLYWKGMDIGIYAFNKLLKNEPFARLTMVGKGKEKKRWMNLVRKLKIEDRVDWIPWVDRDSISDIFNRHNILLFPSLHDSGGMVVLEAMAHGLPVVCLALGGPGIIVNTLSGKKIPVHGKSIKKIEFELYDAIRYLLPPLSFKRYSQGALHRAKDFTWTKLVSSIYSKPIK